MFKVIGKKYIRKLYITVFFSVLISFFELAGLGLIFLYISFIQSAQIPDSLLIVYFTKFLNINNFEIFVLYFGYLLIGIFILKLFASLAYQYYVAKYMEEFRHSVMTKIFKHYMYLDYQQFIAKNSSHFSKTLLNEAKLVPESLRALIDFISETIVLTIIFCILIYFDWKLFVFIFVMFLLLFLFVKLIVKSKIKIIAEDRRIAGEGYFKVFSESIRNFKFIKLINAEVDKLDQFSFHSETFYRVNKLFNILLQFPRYFIESVGFIVVILIIMYFFLYYNDKNIIEMLSLYVIAFYRGLPSLNKINNATMQISYFKNASEQILEDLEMESEDFEADTIEFQDSIELKDITYKHKDAKDDLLDNFNYTIKKGDKIAIVGPSGSGKSTLVDIIMGIISSYQGEIYIDNEKLSSKKVISWRNKFGYIPQEIYLYDATVADNIVFGREYDEEKVIEALKKANIYEYFMTKDGLETLVGEAGVNLSGGQKQRVAIARAIYGNPEILILDEATSALDRETEENIMVEIYELAKDKTLLIIAHRLSTIEKCTRKIEL